MFLLIAPAFFGALASTEFPIHLPNLPFSGKIVLCATPNAVYANGFFTKESANKFHAQKKSKYLFLYTARVVFRPHVNVVREIPEVQGYP